MNLKRAQVGLRMGSVCVGCNSLISVSENTTSAICTQSLPETSISIMYLWGSNLHSLFTGKCIVHKREQVQLAHLRWGLQLLSQVLVIARSWKRKCYPTLYSGRWSLAQSVRWSTFIKDGYDALYYLSFMLPFWFYCNRNCLWGPGIAKG